MKKKGKKRSAMKRRRERSPIFFIILIYKDLTQTISILRAFLRKEGQTVTDLLDLQTLGDAKEVSHMPGGGDTCYTVGPTPDFLHHSTTALISFFLFLFPRRCKPLQCVQPTGRGQAVVQGDSLLWPGALHTARISM